MDPTDPLADFLHVLATSDPQAIAVAFDGSTGALAVGGTWAALRVLDKLPARPKQWVWQWVRARRVKARKAIPRVVPLVLAALRAGLAFAIDADPIMAFVRGAVVGLAAVGANEFQAAGGKVRRAPLEAPTDGAGR
jgi:hypothetical protein